MSSVRKGQKVLGLKKELGTTTGGKRKCHAWCRGKQIAIRWEDGSLTYQCTETMSFAKDTWRIVREEEEKE